jgi:hypothetical protein
MPASAAARLAIESMKRAADTYWQIRDGPKSLGDLGCYRQF